MVIQFPIRSVLVSLGIPLVLVLFSGCATVQILGKDTPPPPAIPFVKIIDNPTSTVLKDRFALSVVLLNPTNNTYPSKWFSLKLEAHYYTGNYTVYCSKNRTMEVDKILQPNGGAEIDQILFDLPNYPAHSCQCFKDKCDGYLDVTLIRTNTKQQVYGAKTKFQISWTASGNASERSSHEIKN